MIDIIINSTFHQAGNNNDVFFFMVRTIQTRINQTIKEKYKENDLLPKVFYFKLIT
jgi:hypothetical protein